MPIFRMQIRTHSPAAADQKGSISRSLTNRSTLKPRTAVRMAIAAVICILFIAIPLNAAAQKKYTSPVDFPILLAGNVGEIRTDAFHAGIDIKGMKGIGSPVFAVADGYVMRVGVSPWGYGNVVYIKHADGAVSVYGHLDQFAPRIAKWVRAQQYAKKSFTVDLYPTAAQFPVKQGDKIATVGNSGSSGGAHVHLEIRDPRTGLPMNLIAKGFYEVADHEKPVLKSVKLFEIDVVDGIEVHRLKESIVPSEDILLNLRDKGYLAYEVVDYKDGKSNTMGIYSLEQRVDGVLNFSFKMDYVDYSTGRYANALVQYDEHRASKFDVIRAYVSTHNLLRYYQGVRDHGVITASEKPINISTTITDDAGNSTLANITIVKDTTRYQAIAPQSAKAVKLAQDFTYNDTKMSVTIKKASLYEDAFLEFGETDGIYTVATADVPLQNAISLVVVAPSGMEPAKMGLVSILSNGTESWVGGSYANGKIVASVKRFGNYKVAQDTTAPTITATSVAARGSNLLRFTITDDLSGIATYTLTIDGAWVLAEYDPKFATLIHQISRGKTPTNHNIVLVVADSKGNSTTFKQTVHW